MALTVTQKQYLDLGNVRGVICNIAFDSSYPTGGEDLTAVAVGLTDVYGVVDLGIGNPGYTYQFLPATSKLLAFNGTTQVANATNLSTLAPDLLFIGK